MTQGDQPVAPTGGVWLRENWCDAADKNHPALRAPLLKKEGSLDRGVPAILYRGEHTGLPIQVVIIMKIGIISDTHDHHKKIDAAVEIFNAQEVKYILHAGDIVSPFAAGAFAKVETAKFIAVFGNNEGEKLFLTSTIKGFGGEISACYKGEIGGKKIFMVHIPHCLDEVVKSQMYDLVIYGHTHRQDIRQVGDTLVINPGEATDWITGQSHLVVLETDDMSYEIVTVY